jgi:synaptobrevin family protein YKT6
VAFDVVEKAMKAFAEKSNDWASQTADKSISVPQLAELLKQYQNPQQVDQLMKIQADVDETKEIMVKNIDKLLDRNEKLEDLVAKSDDLSLQSKTFMKQSKKVLVLLQSSIVCINCFDRVCVCIK